MKPDQPPEDQALLERYRQVSAAEGLRPHDAIRSAIHAEAQRVAAEQRRPQAPTHFDFRQGAANHSRFRRAAYGTAAVCLLGALLMAPFYRPAPPRGARVAPVHTLRADVTPQPAPSPPTERPDAPVLPDTGGAVAERVAPSPPAGSEDRILARAGARKEVQIEAAAQQVQRALAARPQARPSLQPPAQHDTSAPLLRAVKRGDFAQTERLLDQGASLHESDDAGRSPLLLAVMQRRADLVRLLLAYDADPTAADRAGQTPLDWAQRQHDDDMVRLLSGR